MPFTTISKIPHHTMPSTRHLAFAMAILCSLALSAACSTTQASNGRPDSVTSLRAPLAELLDLAGFPRLYKDVAATVVAESRIARQACEDSVDNAASIQRFISQTLNVEQLMRASVEQLSGQIEPSMLDEVADWMHSRPGQLILAAEAQSANWSDEEFARRELALASNPDWNDARRKLLLRVLDEAATVVFVTALHAESSALVLQAGDCIASEASHAYLNNRIDQARAEEGFYRFLLRQDVLTTAAMIFSGISDEDIEAYLRYNQSVAGRAWNKALLTMIRQVLSDRHEPVHGFLATLEQS